jgi:hypothetical protein
MLAVCVITIFFTKILFFVVGGRTLLRQILKCISPDISSTYRVIHSHPQPSAHDLPIRGRPFKKIFYAQSVKTTIYISTSACKSDIRGRSSADG